MKYTATEINELTKNIQNAVRLAEDKYHSKIEKMADAVTCDKSKKVVLIAGPSSSGKTTTAHLLMESLKRKGITTHVISLDNFYFLPNDLPRGEDGKIDYESVHALDIARINKCLENLVNNGRALVPKYDFTVSEEKRKENVEIVLGQTDVAIIEGLHALNPILHKNLSHSSLFKIYISLSSKIHGDNGETLLSSRDLRLIRRISRDVIYRNSSVQNTFKMWPGVLIGEEKFLYCYKKEADFKFDTFHCYEPAVFKETVLKLLEQIHEQSDDYGLAQKLVYGLKFFNSADMSAIPENSLLKEFVAK